MQTFVASTKHSVFANSSLPYKSRLANLGPSNPLEVLDYFSILKPYDMFDLFIQSADVAH